jgi:uncharacterized protein YegP (UPF0339 family)
MTRPRIQYKFVLLKNNRAKQKYHWVCYAPNGQIKFHSENYTTKASMLNVIRKHIHDLRAGIAEYHDETGER